MRVIRGSLFLKQSFCMLWIALLVIIPDAKVSAQNVSQPVSAEDKAYLEGLYKDTWGYLSTHVDAITGLPYDASSRQPPTSMSNVGLYLASVSTAYRTGLISAVDAEQRVKKVLDSLEKVDKWKGIPRPWIITRTLAPTFGDEFTYGPHLSALIGGLLVTQATFPEIVFEGIVPRIRKMLTVMELKTLYDPKTGWLKGGYNVKQDNFAIFQSWGHWYYKHFASETRLLSYYLILRGAAPKEHWFSLIRSKQQLEGETFFVSGYEEGGLYVQFLSGLFLDERATEMGESQKGYVNYQMKHAQTIKSPVWGWSSCLTPQGRYLAYGELRDDIVAPYASILAVHYYPAEVIKNLRALEEKGARPESHPRFGEVHFGFLDSINWQTGDTAKHYLTPNQAMAFLSLANYLHDGIVWKSFSESLPLQQQLTDVSVSKPAV